MESKYLDFIEVGKSPTGRTLKIEVRSKNMVPMGEVKWYGQWRKYCFYPLTLRVLDEHCLDDIAKFIVEKTREHRNKP